jgi:hypothetical protein
VREPARLLPQVAEAIADRAPIDWAAFEASTSPGDRLIGALRSIDRVAGDTADGHAGASPVVRAGAWALPGWTLGVAAACVAVVAGGLAGAVLGLPDRGVVPIGLQVAGGLSFGAMGAWLLLASGDGRGAWLGAWYLTMAAAVSYRPMQWLLPLLPEHGVARGAVSGLVPEVFMPLFLALFVRGFPRVPRWCSADRLTGVTIRIAGVAAALCGTGHALAAGRRPLAPQTDPLFGWMARTHPSNVYWLLLFLPAALALALMLARRRHAEGEERRRGSLFMAGLALGLAPTIAVIVLDAALPSVRHVLDDPRGLKAVAFLTYGLALTTPFTTAHAIRAHHVLSVRFVLRGAIRRVLARSTLTVATLVPTALLGAHMFRHRDQSLATLFSGTNAMVSLGLATLGLVGIGARVHLLRHLDRTLMPRRGDWQASLFRANQNLRRARGAGEMLELLMREIEATLGARGCLMSAVSDGYVSLRGRVPPIPRESALVALAKSAEGPFLVDPSSPHSLFRWLPDPERALVVDGGLAVILPVPGGAEGPRALLALEAPTDGEPYSPDDFLYLGALATAGGMALDSPRAERLSSCTIGATVAEQSAGECKVCGLLQAESAGACTCGAELEPALLPIVLNGKFRLTRRLGSGAMGVAYEAEDLDLARTVALKTLPRVSPDLALRLRQEARSMARVLHPRLAMIFGCESWHGVPVLVLEHLAGTLASRVGCPWRIREALEIGVAAAEGLAAMHDHGLLHRDVKPSNVGFAHDGGVKLLDFGIAHLLTEAADHALSGRAAEGGRLLSAADLDLSSRVVGTPLYCSPERLGGASAGPADDVWSLSLLVYELIAGVHPWRRGDAVPVSLGPIPDLRELRADCPAEVARFFAQALAARPAGRPASAGTLRAALVSLLESSGDAPVAVVSSGPA